ncbi:MAG: ABC transporter ATP-binding protein [Saprospiraceae bacterium]
MISVNNIYKSFEKGKVQALKDISFEVKTGELFGLIGPDGSGKTTLLRILTTVLLADKGQASLNELDVVLDFKSIRSQVGYMPGKFSLYQDLSIEENLEFFAHVFNTSIEQNYELIRDIYIQIEPFKKRRAGALSGGMKQKLALCCALIHRPKILILDEPTTGVDAVSRKEFWEMLKRLKAYGITIIVSTPYMDEADLCDRVALIQAGKILSIGTPSAVASSYSYPLYAIKSENMYPLLQNLRQIEGVHAVHPFGEYLHLTLEKNTDIGTIEKTLGQYNHKKLEIIPIKANIEDVFMELM